MEIVMTNEYLAPFVDELFNLGVREAVFSPGSRSTALAIDEVPPPVTKIYLVDI